jgi:hypothetical protein
MAPSSTTTDEPVLNLINTRLRALRKKLNRITSLEESLSQGKSLNSEQQEVLRSKSAVVALVDELEKLRQPLSSALTEELETGRILKQMQFKILSLTMSQSNK